jgi:hypothetical protein
MSEVVLILPDDIAKEAEECGLFKPFIITSMLRAEIRRRKSNKFFEMIDQLAEVSGEPMSNDEINAEIAAARAERRNR